MNAEHPGTRLEKIERRGAQCAIRKVIIALPRRRESIELGENIQVVVVVAPEMMVSMHGWG